MKSIVVLFLIIAFNITYFGGVFAVSNHITTIGATLGEIDQLDPQNFNIKKEKDIDGENDETDDSSEDQAEFLSVRFSDHSFLIHSSYSVSATSIHGCQSSVIFLRTDTPPPRN